MILETYDLSQFEDISRALHSCSTGSSSSAAATIT